MSDKPPRVIRYEESGYSSYDFALVEIETPSRWWFGKTRTRKEWITVPKGTTALDTQP